MILVPVTETFEAFQKLYEAGQVKSIGISNFSIAQVEEACEVSELPICTNQVEYHVRRNRSELRDYCQARNIVMTAHRPLAVGNLASDTVLRAIGENHGKTAAQVALRVVSAARHHHNPKIRFGAASTREFRCFRMGID